MFRCVRPALVCAVAAAAALITSCSGGQAAQNGPGSGDTNYVNTSVGTTTFKAGQRPDAPSISGTTLTGSALRLSQYRGKVVVLNFWASWCAPCRAEAPAMAQLSGSYASRGVQFVGVNVKDPGKVNAQAFDRNLGIGYPSLYDPAGETMLAFRQTVPPSGIPSTLVIDRTGHIAGRVIGQVTYSSLKQLLSQVTA
ncbi:MAG: TlpA family protein disulfide reductase [Actinobacteria bacterium]|nr:TlpA family protein disulfide reductase [Actinomycetota bacterium]